jgi:adenylate kinase
MRLILLGAPGSGKGTIAAELKNITGIPHISTGDIFRHNIRNATPLGEKASEFIKQGALVPDEITIGMVAGRLREDDCEKGFMLDGFPRTIVQANALTGILNSMNVRLTAVINVVLDDQTVVRRLAGRRVCRGCGKSYNQITMQPKTDGVCDDCGGEVVQREDDKPETVAKRLETYHEQTSPLEEFYRQQGIMIDVRNDGTSQEAVDLIRKRLNI